MRQARENADRIMFSLLISGVTVVPAYIMFLILWGVVFEGPQSLASLYEIFTQESKARRLHIFIMVVSLFVVPVFVLFYGGLVYNLLAKYKQLSFLSIVFCSLGPAVVGAMVIRDVGVFVVLSYFCVWHSTVFWCQVKDIE